MFQLSNAVRDAAPNPVLVQPADLLGGSPAEGHESDRPRGRFTRSVQSGGGERISGTSMDSATAGPDRVSDSSSVPFLRTAPLLVGRTLEQLFLREELAAVIGGRGRLV